ncbi:CDP-alcohol phosphatidyltransferase family protein [Cesiribacter andamanensis]|uniref:CDP-diacylglycerol-serine O-phosphatidyltransferase n=1 Tax=Cesiribacter andamanensis AMV16 TaxID=1279009 RepID=M7NS78_9BACT|nr:CDP-alcohol phosphatidyltransferase family protein [Cesiribacter andamanensis]EMR04555.1 CDP-diacylglycerol-serine O-phosphatidyltransferase [Cesiribacter andamanensis AMV16]
MSIRHYIPNALTCSNLVCGCLGLVAVLEGKLIWAPYLIWLAGLFDFLDGFAARQLKVSSPIGGELDSLADMVTFGVLPSMLLFVMLREPNLAGLEMAGIDMASWDLPGMTMPGWVPYLAFVVAVFSALRLAKFNVDTRQTTSFIGVPTPANALLISSFPLIVQQQPDWSFIWHPAFLLAVAFGMSFLLVAEIPLFALKFKDFSWQGNRIKYIFLLLSVLLIIFFKFVAIPLIILLYVFLSLLTKEPEVVR